MTKKDTRSFWERNEASGGMLLNVTMKKYAISIFRAILLFGMCFMILQPILNKISLSFMAEKDLYDTSIVIIPKNFSVNNWKISMYLLDYTKSLINTIVSKFSKPPTAKIASRAARFPSGIYGSFAPSSMSDLKASQPFSG